MSEPIQSIATNNYLLATPIGSGYMETSALEFDGDKISGYAGSAFKAGDEFPQSATDAIETVSANSGAWGGSALSVSAGPGIKLEMVNDTLVASTDETVLWSGDALSATISESITSFDSVKIYAHWSYNGGYQVRTMTEIPGSATSFNLFSITPAVTTEQASDAKVYTLVSIYNINGLNLTPINASRIQYAAVEGSMSCNSFSNTDVLKLTKIVGLDRIAGGN